MKLACHASHRPDGHKGMGGNPKGERSIAAHMIYVCSARHREHTISIDRFTVRWRPLTNAGANGPVAWDVDLPSDIKMLRARQKRWIEVAREVSIGVLEPLTAEQTRILKQLAEMTL